MNLTSGQLYWPAIQSDQGMPYPKLEEDIACDVLVVGGGIAGTSCAYALHKAGVDTVLVDKRRIGCGSTSANTGLLQYSNDIMLTSCIENFGEQAGVRFYRLGLEALDHLERESSELDVFPDFYRRDSLCFASKTQDVPLLKKEFDALAAHGFPARYLDSCDLNDLFAFEKPAAILTQGDAEVNPFGYARSLALTGHRRGMRIFERTEVRRLASDRSSVTFVTAEGKKIKARKAVLTMGYETQEIQCNSSASLSSTYAIATEPVVAGTISGWPDRCLIWETARPYLYMRRTADERVIVGGLDIDLAEPEERDRRLEGKSKRLLADTIKLFPSLEGIRIDYAWSGTFCSTDDGLPLIGEQDGFPNCYFALIYGGNGMIYSAMASKIIVGLITSGRHADAALFGFDRPTLRKRAFLHS
ncbi:NAD(P)/FAD-dependent oxidoreductase [Paenibacillus puerhi]|uniref:NAD(P)/FAD-dependent oxidoreductase n=1 Tax=Paenibacillus puerhi TaxID=2692622 RepID=UPI00135B3C8E|nr:FAD-dependent oxidoreductase [Paenibacillus puerhi]